MFQLFSCIAEEAIRTIHADGREEDSEAVTEHDIRTWHHVEAPCVVDGELSFAKLLDIDELLVVRDSALRTLPRRKLYQQTLEHILTLLAESNMIIFYNTQMITALTFQCTAHYMFGVHHYRGNTLMAAFMHRYAQYSRYRDVTHDSQYHRPRHENQCSRRPHPPGLEVVPLGGEGRGFLASSCLRFPDPQRPEKIACLTASSNARGDCEVASTSCTSLHNDVVASRIRVYGVPCRSTC